MSTGAEPVEVAAQAKLTLSLRVTGVRGDGYHLLESEMVTLDLADTLTFEEGDGLTISPEPFGAGFGWPAPPISTGPDNLVARALVATGRTAKVHVVKRIPPGAGLGGGSADAAAVLRWAGQADAGVAAGLGADVPFCVIGGRALVQGVGEVIQPLPYRDEGYTLLLLPFGVDTAAVYRAYDQLHEVGAEPSSVTANQLEAAAVVVEPRLDRWRHRLADLAGQRPRLAGSGSTWFVEGHPETLGLKHGQVLRLEQETAVVVAARTTPAEA